MSIGVHPWFNLRVFAVPKTMRAVVYRGVNDLRLETVPVPHVGPHELLVRVAVCGVCPTDIKKILHGTVPPPRIFGHETAGTIVKIGGNRTSLEIPSPIGWERVVPPSRDRVRVGDRVALHHHVPCLDCHFCRHRAFAQCATYKRTGITAGFDPAGGGYAEYVRVLPFVLPGVVKIPAKNSFDEGAMLEPVNTVLKAVKRLSLLPGDTVLVAGQGPIGLMFTKLLQLRGVNVLATDLLAARLRLAKKFGARWALNAAEVAAALRLRDLQPQIRSRSLQAASPVRDLKVAATGPGLDAAVVAVPSDAVVQQALQLVRGGGQVLLFAHTKRKTNHQSPMTNYELDFSSICLDEKDLIGRYSSDFTLQREVARLVFTRQLDVRRLITHRFPLEQTAAAVALAAQPAGDSLKIMVTQS